MGDVIDELVAVMRQRKANPTPDSYTARLLAAGEDEIVKKIGEEAIELILAAKGQGNQRLVEETADLIYHILVLLVDCDLSWEHVRAELEKRRR